MTFLVDDKGGDWVTFNKSDACHQPGNHDFEKLSDIISACSLPTSQSLLDLMHTSLLRLPL
jgi:hypothetical protein